MIDFTPQLAKIKTLNPDAIFISGPYNEVPLKASQGKRQGIMTQLLGADGVFSPEYMKMRAMQPKERS